MPKRRCKEPRHGSESQFSQPCSSLQSQTNLEQFFSVLENVEVNLEDSVNNCIRYIVYRAGSNLPISKNEIQQHVLHGAGKNFAPVMEHVATVLQKVYGYKLQPCEYLNNSKPRSYIVSNLLPYVNYDSDDEDDEETVPSNVHNVLVMLVLTHVFMSKGPVSDASLYAFLNNLSIDVEKKHELFGNVKDYINTSMVKQKYLNVQVENAPKKIIMYTWGTRAEKNVSKHELLKFVAKMYGNRQPESWNAQFEEATNQNLQQADETESQDEIMDLE